MSNVTHVEFRQQPAKPLPLEEIQRIIREQLTGTLVEHGFDRGVAARVADMIARQARRPIERLAKESTERGGTCQAGTALGALLEGIITTCTVLAHSDRL